MLWADASGGFYESCSFKYVCESVWTCGAFERRTVCECCVLGALKHANTLKKCASLKMSTIREISLPLISRKYATICIYSTILNEPM